MFLQRKQQLPNEVLKFQNEKGEIFYIHFNTLNLIS